MRGRQESRRFGRVIAERAKSGAPELSSGVVSYMCLFSSDGILLPSESEDATAALDKAIANVRLDAVEERRMLKNAFWLKKNAPGRKNRLGRSNRADPSARPEERKPSAKAD